MQLKLVRSAVIEMDGHRFVEMNFTAFDFQAARDDRGTAQFLDLRIDVDREGYPRPPEAHLEALQHVRTAVSAEIQRLEALIDAKR